MRYEIMRQNNKNHPLLLMSSIQSTKRKNTLQHLKYTLHCLQITKMSPHAAVEIYVYLCLSFLLHICVAGEKYVSNMCSVYRSSPLRLPLLLPPPHVFR